MREINDPEDRDSELGEPERSPRIVGNMECREVEMPPIEAASNMITGIVTDIVVERTHEEGTLTYDVGIQAVEGVTSKHTILAERAQIESSPPVYAANIKLDGHIMRMAARYTHYRGMQLTRAFISFEQELSLTDEEYEGMSNAVVATMAQKFHPRCREIYFQIDGGEGRFETIKLRGELP